MRKKQSRWHRCFTFLSKRYDGANAVWKEIAAKYEIVAKEREARLEPPAAVEEKKEEKEEKKEVATKKPIKWNIPQSQFVPSRTNL